MSETPDPQAVREIAENAMRGAVRDHMFWHVNQAVIEYGVPGPVSKGGPFETHRNAAIAEYKRMAAALLEPDEQPQDERDALAEVTAELDAANDDADRIADQCAAYREEIMRLRTRVRELDGAQDERDGDVDDADVLAVVRSRMATDNGNRTPLAAVLAEYGLTEADLDAREAKAAKR